MLSLLEQQQIIQDCHRFLIDSNGIPLYKVLNKSTHTFKRIKLRKRNFTNDNTELFNSVFESKLSNIRQRSLICSSKYPDFVGSQNQVFYVFPFNGYKFLYNKEFKDFEIDVKGLIEMLKENITEENYKEVASTLMELSYNDTNLLSGLQTQSEIVFYGISKFYVVKQDKFPDYRVLYNHLLTMGDIDGTF